MPGDDCTAVILKHRVVIIASQAGSYRVGVDYTDGPLLTVNTGRLRRSSSVA